MSSCKTCDQIFDRGRTSDVKIKCKLCENQFHTSCVKVTSSDFKTINNSANVLWFCDQCVDRCALFNTILSKIDEIAITVKKNAEKLDKHDEILTKLNQGNGLRFNLNATPNTASPTIKRAYADVAAERTNFESGSDTKRQRKKNNPVKNAGERPIQEPILIVTKRSAADQTDVRTRVKSVLNPLTDPVKTVNLSAQGKAVVRCTNHESLPVIKQRLQHELGNDVEIDVPKALSPRVTVIGVDPEYVSESPEVIIVDGEPDRSRIPADCSHFLSILFKQNENVFTSESTVTVTYARQRKDKRYNICLSSDRSTFERMIEADKMRVGWDLCYVREHVGVQRCFNCNTYTTKHKSSDCPYPISCPKCGGSHSHNNCDTLEKKCVNCCRANDELRLNLPTNHYVWSTQCSVYLRQVSRKKERIRYAD